MVKLKTTRTTPPPAEIGTVADTEKREDEAERAEPNTDEQQVVSEPQRDLEEQPVRDSGPTETLSSEETNEPEPTPAEMSEAEAAIEAAMRDMDADAEDDTTKIDDPDGLLDDLDDTATEPVEPKLDANGNPLPFADPELDPGSAETVEDELNPGRSRFLASHNEAGHRNMFVNLRGEVTIMDDEVAETFYENPHFHSYTWDEGQKNSVHVSTLQWCDRNGQSIGEQVGKPYDLNR